MQNPIGDGFWRKLFHVSAGITTAALLVSLWSQRRAGASKIAPHVKVLQAKKASEQEVEDAIVAIQTILDEEARSKSGTTRLAVHSAIGTLLTHLRAERENPHIVCGILRIIQRCVVSDPEARVAFNKAGGYKRVMIALSDAHRAGAVTLMDEAAATLRDLTNIDDGEIVLACDVPTGSEGTYALCCLPSACKMLRTLDQTSRPTYVAAAAGIFANMCSLQVGSRQIASSVIDGVSGPAHFIRLLDATGNALVVEASLRALRWLVFHADKVHAEVAEEECVQNIISTVQLNRDIRSLSHVMHLVLTMTKSKLACQFFTLWYDHGGMNSLFELWTRGVDKGTRDLAAITIHTIHESRQEPRYSDKMKKLFEQYRSAIAERRSLDEEARKKQQQQMRQQQQMMQQMMMMQEGGGMGGGGMGMEDEEM